MSKPKLMVIDDLDSARSMMKRTLARSCEVYDFAAVAEALPAVERADFDCIVTDLRMPGIDGLEGLRRFKAKVPHIPVILVTAFASVDTVKEAWKAGAFDFVQKPFEPELLELAVAKAVEHVRVLKDNQRLRAELKGGGGVQGIVGRSQAMKDVTSVVQRIAGSNVPILIEGESGTGKDLLARAAHGMSARAAGPYVALNMSAIPENLAEAELFGHEKGAFTGAEQARDGFFAEAEGGTLFLDELGMLPPALQPKLLRVLQDGEYIPVGSRKARKADVRVIAATNEDLARAVKEGKFREDLWFRLRVVPVRLPPLRERREDIPALVEHFVQKHALRLGRPPLQPDAAAMKALLDHAWPGNIRELEHAVERGLLLAQGSAITLADLPPELTPAPGAGGAAEGRYKRERDAWERGWLAALLREVDGNVTRAAEVAGLDRSTVYDKLKRYGLLDK